MSTTTKYQESIERLFSPTKPENAIRVNIPGFAVTIYGRVAEDGDFYYPIAKIKRSDSLSGAMVAYTHVVTNTELRFFISLGHNPHTKGYYVLSAYRLSGDTLYNPVAHELINPDRKKKLGVHGSGAYFGPKEKILVPIKERSEKDALFAILPHFNVPLTSALDAMDLDVTDVTEDDDIDKKLAAVVEMDKVIAEYQELLHEEFNN